MVHRCLQGRALHKGSVRPCPSPDEIQMPHCGTWGQAGDVPGLRLPIWTMDTREQDPEALSLSLPRQSRSALLLRAERPQHPVGGGGWAQWGWLQSGGKKLRELHPSARGRCEHAFGGACLARVAGCMCTCPHAHLGTGVHTNACSLGPDLD